MIGHTEIQCHSEVILVGRAAAGQFKHVATAVSEQKLSSRALYYGSFCALSEHVQSVVRTSIQQITMPYPVLRKEQASPCRQRDEHCLER